MSHLLMVVNSIKPHLHQRNLSEKSISTTVSHKNPPAKLTVNHAATTVLNFDPSLRSKKFLTSPRSIEALNRLCINEEELLMKLPEDFMDDELPAEFQNDSSFYIELKLEHYEKRRREKVKMCIEERERYIEELSKPNITQSSSMMSLNHSTLHDSRSRSQDRSGFLEKEKKKVEKQQKMFKKELQQLISSEMKQREFTEKNEQKLRRIKELEEMRTKELRKKVWVYEKERDTRLSFKVERDKRVETMAFELLRRQEEEAKKQRETQERLWSERKMAIKEREQQRKLKLEVLNNKIREMERKKKLEMEIRKKIIESKNEKFKQYMMATLEKKHREGEKLRHSLELKILNAKKSVDRSLSELRNRVDEKLEDMQRKRERLENERIREIEIKKIKSAQKVAEIQRMLEEKQKREERKKQIYIAKLESIEQTRARVESTLERRHRLKLAEASEKENRIKEQIKIRDHIEENLRLEKEEQLFGSLRRAEENKLQSLQESKRKFLMEILRLQDAAENVARLEKVKERKRLMYLEKMNLEQNRTEKIQETKDFQLQHRKKLQQILNYEKYTMFTEFERRKRKLFVGTFGDKDMQSILASPSQSKKAPPAHIRTNDSSAGLALNRFKQMYNSPLQASVLNSSLRSPQSKSPKKDFFFMKRQSVDKKDPFLNHTTPQKTLLIPPQKTLLIPPPKILPKKPEIKPIVHSLEELMNKKYEIVLQSAQAKNFLRVAEKLNDEIQQKPNILESSEENLLSSAEKLLVLLRQHEEEYDNIRMQEDGYFLFKK